ncbi:hypothetical protein, partial [Metallibacterium scheffleri]|uniref:hypothetical protein n=1 Tax=Metallibacterium scheffleri TaxID=993689 RepID=UPI0023F55D28
PCGPQGFARTPIAALIPAHVPELTGFRASLLIRRLKVQVLHGPPLQSRAWARFPPFSQHWHVLPSVGSTTRVLSPRKHDGNLMPTK